MKVVFESLESLKCINDRYELSTQNQEIETTLDEMDQAKVCTPIVGKFSSGKSALINALIEIRILKEDIEPKTAVPTEIVYSATREFVDLYTNEGGIQSVSINEYRAMDIDANFVKHVRIHLNHRLLQEVGDIMIVDMPGFESGFEVHNKAIDEYVVKSLAYFFAFPADDMIVRESMGKLLRSLNQHDVPIYIVITKSDKRNDNFDELLKNLKLNLCHYVPKKEIPHCVTSSLDGDVDQFEKCLFQIQDQADAILTRKYARIALNNFLYKTKGYLERMKNDQLMTLSELEEQADKKEKQLSAFQNRLEVESSKFEKEIRECVVDIIGDVEVALDSEKSTYVTMSLNNQDIKSDIEQLVRETVTSSVKKRFIPKIQKYIQKVNETTDIESAGAVKVLFHFDASELNRDLTSSVVRAIGIGTILGPIIGLISFLIDKVNQDKKRDEAKRKICEKLESNVFPTILKDVERNLEMSIMENVESVKSAINHEIQSQNEIQQKVIADLRVQLNEERDEREAKDRMIKDDLQRVLEIETELSHLFDA